MHGQAGIQRCDGVTTVEYAWSSRHVDVWRSNHSRVCMVKQACRGVRSNHSRVCMVKQACRGVRSNHSRVCMVKQACRGVAE